MYGKRKILNIKYVFYSSSNPIDYVILFFLVYSIFLVFWYFWCHLSWPSAALKIVALVENDEEHRVRNGSE